jgi:hypothetical protein
VARLTALTEVAGNVIRIRGPLEIRGVTLVAIRVDELIVVVRMAGGTRGGNMRSRQCKLRCAMVERCGGPGRRGMTRLAYLAKAARSVIRVFCSLEIGGVALIAISVRKLVIAVRMACLAGNGTMSPCQRKFCGVVVKRRWLPRRR